MVMGTDKKARQIIAELGIHKNTRIILPDNKMLEIGDIIPDGKCNTADITLFYERNRKPKVIERISLEISKALILNSSDILSAYDRVFVIDTNYTHNQDETCCAAAIGELIFVTDRNTFALIKLGHICFTIDLISQDNPEKISWSYLVKAIEEGGSTDHSYAIITDSELGNLKKYNEGEPFLNEVRLPNNIKFMYASSDKRDTILNWAISQCDRGASELLKNYIASINGG